MSEVMKGLSWLLSLLDFIGQNISSFSLRMASMALACWEGEPFISVQDSPTIQLPNFWMLESGKGLNSTILRLQIGLSLQFTSGEQTGTITWFAGPGIIDSTFCTFIVARDVHIIFMKFSVCRAQGPISLLWAHGFQVRLNYSSPGIKPLLDS